MMFFEKRWHMFIFAFCYLSLPVFLILFTFFSTPFVGLSAVALTAIVFCLCNSHYSKHKGHFQARILIGYWPLLVVAVVISCLCMAFPFKFWDWEKHYTVFNLLSRAAWPPMLELNGQEYFLRYYTAWYVLPSLISKLFSKQFLTFAMIIWTSVGIFTTLFLAFYKVKKLSHLFIVAGVFFLFSGLDAVGILYRDEIEQITPHWLQWWSLGGYIGSYLFNLSLLPQHTVGTCLAVCLFLYNRYLAVRYSALITTVVVMWSPFCALGLLPVVIWSIAKEGYKSALTIQNLIIAPLLAAPILLYLSQGAEQIPLMFVWQWEDFSLSESAIFVISEFVIITLIMYWLRPQERSLIAALGVFLAILYFFRGGEVNDMMSRGAVASICVLSILAAKQLIEKRGWQREVLSFYLIIGALPVAVAFVKGIMPSTERPDKNMSFEKLTSIYTYEEHPYMTFSYLVSVSDMKKVWGIPILRDRTELERR